MANSIWTKRALVPVWTTQLLLTLVLIALYIVVCVLDTPYHYSGSYEDFPKQVQSFLFISTIVFIILDILVCGAIVFQIVWFSHGHLTALTMFVSQIMLATYWTVCLVLTVLNGVGVVGGDGASPLKRPIIYLFLIIDTIVFYGSLIYVSVIFARARRTGDIHSAETMEEVQEEHREEGRQASAPETEGDYVPCETYKSASMSREEDEEKSVPRQDDGALTSGEKLV